MTTPRNEFVHPYALLDRRQSRRVSSMPIGDCLQSVMERKTEAPPYDDLINFPRAKDKDDIRCVMCGLPPGMACVIPRQNKDVCKVWPLSYLLCTLGRPLWHCSPQLLVVTSSASCYCRNVTSRHGNTRHRTSTSSGVRVARNFSGSEVSRKSSTRRSAIVAESAGGNLIF